MGKLNKNKFLSAALLSVCALSILPTFVKANVEFNPKGMTVIGAKGVSSYTRKVATSIGIYTKNGKVPAVIKKQLNYAGVKIHVLEVDATDKSGTFIQVDYAGKDSDDSPKFLNKFYDKDLTKNNAYYWIGATNAGFFNSTSSSNMYGYPTGAVKINGTEQTYNSSGTGNEDWNCSPAYGNGFTTLHLNKDRDMKLIYNGWKGGNFYKYAGDKSPNSWDYGDYENYQDAVSGAYTLKVDGNNTTWGKGDYTSVDYWTYRGTGVTLFGQKSNGNYVLVTTEAALPAEDQQGLMNYLDCSDAIRFDGGGSTQMAYDKGLVLNHYYMSKAKKEYKQGESLTTDDIGFDLYMEDGSYHWATPNDAPQVEFVVYDSAGEIVDDISSVKAGTYRLTSYMNGLEQSLDIKITENKHTVTFKDWKGETIHTATVDDGGSVMCPVDMQRKGYTFDGWDVELTNITGDITANPRYTAVPYKLILDLNGGIAENPTEYTIEDEFVVNNPTKAGYRFIGWSLPEGASINTTESDDMPEEISSQLTTSPDDVLSVEAEEQKNGDNPIINDNKNQLNNLINTSELITELKITKGTTGDLHYIANYQPLTGSITYRFDMEGVTNNNPTTFTPGQKLTLNKPSAKGYKFIGWYINGNPAPDGIISEDISGEIEVYGEFELLKYSISFDDPKVETIEFDITQLPLNLPQPQPQDGLRFEGWYLESNFKGEKLVQINDIGSLELYGKWVADVPEIKSIKASAKIDQFFAGQKVTNDMFIVETIDTNGNHREIQDFTIEGGESLVEGDNLLTFRHQAFTCELIVKAKAVSENPSGDQTVKLSAHKASAYTVRLPKVVDVSEESTSFDVTVQGDIAGDERLSVRFSNGFLRPIGAKNQSKDIPVLVDFNGNDSYTYIHNEINAANTKRVTLNHDSLEPGNYEGSLSVTIAVENGAE